MFDVAAKGEIGHSMEQDPRWLLVLRIAESRSFKSSPRLRDFLFYVADCSIHARPEEATEQQIGMRVFGRTPGYNSSEDSIVRSHARLLRQKLAAYFENEGANESLRIEVPKGRYQVVFTPLGPAAPVAPAKPSLVLPATSTEVPAPSIETVAHQEIVSPLPLPVAQLSKPWRWSWVLPLLAGMVIGAGILFAIHQLTAIRPDRNVAKLWRPFLHGDPPLLIYSNAIFVGDSKSGMRYARPQELQSPAPRSHLIDNYTGIGETTGVFELAHLFETAHATFILKRSHLVTWDEAKQQNLIFIGSPAENLAVQALPANMEFTLVSTAETSGYRNNHAHPGEPAAYMRPEYPLTQDYALISFLPGMQSGKNMMLLSGLTTLGTQAAVEFATRPDGAAQLLKAAADRKGQVRPFEALLETTIVGGVPVETRLVTIHTH